jgi:raffinose/stachyose/melibiose transport system permease protein
MQQILPRGGRKRKVGTWIRYHWWILLVHLLLIGFAVVNLYPFVWMIGSSLKTEAEASSEMFSPVPGQKYRLAEGFNILEVIPVTLAPGVSDEQMPSPEQLIDIRNKLVVIESLQRSMLEENLRGLLNAEWRRIRSQAIDAIVEQARLAYLKSYAEWRKIGKAIDAIVEQARQAYLKSWARENPDQAAEGQEPKTVPQPSDEQIESRLPAHLRQDAKRPLQVLLDLDLLVRDGNQLWLPAPAAAGQGLAEMTTYQRSLYAKVRQAQLLTPKRYSIPTKLSVEQSAENIRDLQQIGVLEPVLPPDHPQGPAWHLAAGARHEIYRDLLPRQILTLWSMHEENVRRAESRDVFPSNSWKAVSYSKKYGLADPQLAAGELAEMAEEGMLENATIQWMNYWVVLKEENFLLHFSTSCIITVVVVFATVLVSSMLGYALARMQFPGKFVALGVVIAASVLPAEARIIPIFKMLLGLRLVDNLWGMVLWLTSFGVGNSLLMAGFFLTLPPEVDEAAEVDGAGVFRKFFDVGLPMARPIVMTVGMFAFLTSWNNFLVPLLCTISRPSMQPLAVAVYNFQQGHQGKLHQINAAASLMIVPVILLFLFIQKHVVKSIAVGAVKG